MRDSPEIEAIVRRIIASRALGEASLINSLSGSEDLVLVGSADHEWFHGQDALRILWAQHAELSVYESELLRIHAFEDAAVGWAVVEDRRTYPTGRRVTYRWTLVFELEEGYWKVVHSHLSAPVPNLDTVGIELTRSLEDLVGAVGDGAGLPPAAGVTGTATLMFTDVVDSTPMSMSLGETAWLELIRSHLQNLQQIVEDQGGTVVKTLGDGGMYAFASGTSALRAAKLAQEGVANSSDPRLRIRIGIHTGDVLETASDYLGSAVAKAARVAAAAGPGQILVSATTVGLLNASEFAFGTPITIDLKGVDGTQQLWPLVV